MEQKHIITRKPSITADPLQRGDGDVSKKWNSPAMGSYWAIESSSLINKWTTIFFCFGNYQICLIPNALNKPTEERQLTQGTQEVAITKPDRLHLTQSTATRAEIPLSRRHPDRTPGQTHEDLLPLSCKRQSRMCFLEKEVWERHWLKDCANARYKYPEDMQTHTFNRF